MAKKQVTTTTTKIPLSQTGSGRAGNKLFRFFFIGSRRTDP